MIPSTDGSSVTSDSYTTTSYSTTDPPSHLNLPSANQSTMSGISDPSAATSSSSHFLTHNVATMSVFTPVLEETNSALEEASASFGQPFVAETVGSRVKTSVDADGVNIEVTSNLRSPSPPVFPLECDYDLNPTDLYQAIESKKWERIAELFTKEPQEMQKQAATWVTRKEANGKLRWRLLPIHAAVIFQSPSAIVEKLLHECPEAAQAKDDQGMLPLHLAFRTKNTDWEAIEELVTSYPQAIFIKDRKGRAPLECGLAAAAAAIASEANQPGNQASLIGAFSPGKQKQTPQTPVSNNGRAITPSAQKAIFSVLELYTQISVQDQLQTAMHTSRKALETRIGAVQDSHVSTLTQLKKDWENQRNELSRKIQGYRKEIQNLKSDFNIQQDLLEEKVKTEMELVDKLQQVTTALESKTVMDEGTTKHVARELTNMSSEDLKEANQRAEVLKKSNKELLLLLETLLDQQNALKVSLDKLSWETNTKHEERKELVEKYLVSSDQSVNVTTSYTQEWQSRLEATTMDVSAKLANILSHNQRVSGDSSTAAVDEYDGEEKKDAHHHGSVLHLVQQIDGSRQDP